MGILCGSIARCGISGVVFSTTKYCTLLGRLMDVWELNEHSSGAGMSNKVSVFCEIRLTVR